MAWVVDTSVVLDLIIGDPSFEPQSTQCLQTHLEDGLLLCPVSFAEIGPAFAGVPAVAETFLQQVSIDSTEPWLLADTHRAHELWHRHQERRRQMAAPKRPIADVLIAAFAARFQGLISRNTDDFRKIDPNLTLIEP